MIIAVGVAMDNVGQIDTRNLVVVADSTRIKEVVLMGLVVLDLMRIRGIIITSLVIVPMEVQVQNLIVTTMGVTTSIIVTILKFPWFNLLDLSNRLQPQSYAHLTIQLAVT
jgi:hypothetical protein